MNTIVAVANELIANENRPRHILENLQRMTWSNLSISKFQAYTVAS